MSAPSAFRDLIAELTETLGLGARTATDQESVFLEVDGEIMVAIAAREVAHIVVSAEYDAGSPISSPELMLRMLTVNAGAAVLGQPTVGLADGGRTLRVTIGLPLAGLNGAALTTLIGETVDTACAWRDQIRAVPAGANAGEVSPPDWTLSGILRA
jgi:hypothetical protein